VLDEIAAAGFLGVELGPIGYLPEDPTHLRTALESRGLRLAGGYIMERFHDPDANADIMRTAERTCRLLEACGARHVVLIAALVPQRSRTAGRPEAAPALHAAAWTTLVTTVQSVAAVATSAFGLAPAFHPHVGTYVEFADEIDRLMAATDPGLVGLCVDTGHALYAGIDPADLFGRYADRATYLHLKDVRGDVLASARARGLAFEDAVAAGVFCPLGRGEVDFPSFRAALAAAEYEGWAAFEQDRLVGDPLAQADAEASLRYARRVGIATEPEPAIERSPA